MPEQLQIALLVAALLVVLFMLGCHTIMLLKLMGDVEKFGRQLLKVRRFIKGKVPVDGK